MNLQDADLQRIFEAGRTISSTLRLSELLQTVIRLAGEVVHSEAASLLLLDPATGELYFDVALGEKGGALQHIRLKKGEGIAGWVAQEQKPAVVNDAANDPRWTQKGDKTSQFKTRSILAVPMLHQGRLIGVMEALNRVNNQPYSDTDVQILETFAAQAAVAIENARLFESIRQEKEKMATILGEMAEGAVLLDAQGRIVLTNPSARTFLGEAASEGRRWSDLETAFTMQPAWQDVQTALGGAGGIELTRNEAPALILSGVVNQVCNDKGEVTGYLTIFSDVTEERREAQLKRNFLSLVSHKLKTPLVSLRGFTPMLLEKPEELNPFQKTAIEAIDRNSQLLASLVDKLVWFSALESDHLELQRKPYAVAPLIETALSDLAPFLRQAPALIEQRQLASLPMMPLDKTWMKEVFRNLIENAVKFNPKPDRKVIVSGSSDGHRAQIQVQDNGPGMPPEELGKIFSKFYQIDANFTGQVQGMGLGLALVKRVVEEHGGSVSVESTLGHGSTFTVILPI